MQNTGGMIVNKWFEDKRNVDPNYFVVPETESTLSEFGDVMTQEMGVELHEEILLCLLISLLGFDNDAKLRFHVLFHGPVICGKNRIPAMVETLSVPGLMYRVPSGNIEITDECHNGQIMLIDELHESGEGTGNVHLKEVLSTGQLKSEMCTIVHGTRLMKQGASEFKGSFIACTNLNLIDIHTLDRFYVRSIPRPIPKAIADRFYVLYKPHALESMAKKWSTLQMLAYRLQDMGLNSIMDQEVEQTLKTIFHQLDIGSRSRERVKILTAAVTIYHALSKVFMSGTVLAPGTAFNDEHFVHCKPYLTSTPEHAQFALRMMFGKLLEQ